ncbi:hypothetical protein BD410DRAFT_790284 [Rickenella mellea]|uniref:RING-type domain-containing protein n=1 Tax=Rickenella mellea TaxID=50990 RepID=A0A4Y7Q0S3_9AGAM|nr:hypothetical protein BD410DRAFT_790284 [Rickenella mellea]
MYECPLCFQSFGERVMPVALPCGHVFCHSDIRRMDAVQDSRCPTCRKDFIPGPNGNCIRLFLSNSAPASEGLTSSERQEAHILSERMRSIIGTSFGDNTDRTVQDILAWAQRIRGGKSQAALAELMASLHLMTDGHPTSREEFPEDYSDGELAQDDNSSIADDEFFERANQVAIDMINLRRHRSQSEQSLGEDSTHRSSGSPPGQPMRVWRPTPPDSVKYLRDGFEYCRNGRTGFRRYRRRYTIRDLVPELDQLLKEMDC